MRGQLAYDARLAGEKHKEVYYRFGAYLLMDFLSRPDFIAYCHQHKYSVSRLVIKALFRPLNVAWTIRSQEELDLCKNDFDLFIFEGFTPKA